MNKVNLTYLTFCQVLRIALLITSMDINNVTENSIINDIYKLDPKTAKIDVECVRVAASVERPVQGGKNRR